MEAHQVYRHFLMNKFLSKTIITENKYFEYHCTTFRTQYELTFSRIKFKKVVITHEETQFDKTAFEGGCTSTSVHEMTLTIEVAASPRLMSKYIIVLIFADFIIVHDVLYIERRYSFLGSTRPWYFAQRNSNQVKGCMIINTTKRSPNMNQVYQLKPVSLK